MKSSRTSSRGGTRKSEGIYGYGPGHIALPDIRTLSRAIELGLSAASKALDPPGLVNSDAVFGELDLRPAAQTPVDGDPRLAWVPLESGAKFDVGQILERKLEEKIERIFYWDQLQLQGDKLMTATEVERRLELMRRVLGPTLGRFESELLSPLLNRCFGLMYRAGALAAAARRTERARPRHRVRGPAGAESEGDAARGVR